MTMVHSIINHEKMIRLLHTHLYQVTFSLCWPYIYMLDEKKLILWFFNTIFKLLQWSLVTPAWSSLVSCVDLIPPPNFNFNQVSHDLWLIYYLTHHSCSLLWDIYLDKNPTLVHLPTCYPQPLHGISLFWSLQDISPEYFLPIVLAWWKIWCLTHLHDCGEPWWLVSFPYWLMIL